MGRLKKKRVGLTIEESLDILDIDLNPYAYRSDKRGAISVLRKALAGEVQVEYIEGFETSQCLVSIYKTNLHYLNDAIYVLTSVHKNNDKLLVRFGNASQIACIKNSYKRV